ncbi:CYTH and CHAD domain-containing protein [Cohaesibacter sp. CAU 1516]|uniref:CYTH and CHAD domain-containing protein n=1 Tax=Cohaesibacter sp. CAU 1516 TaxID=2576038 RepID=UPI00148559AD|nr:CYTH and CHAD domain-containing protein [Cohaesibacter sp. CAU 1516]
MSNKTAEELELKIQMDVGELRALQAKAEARAGSDALPAQRRLRSIYFDTADHALRKAGIALRVRDDDGCWIQTIKAKTKVQGGVSNPQESETEIAGPKPQLDQILDGSLRAKVQDATNGALVLPIFETVVERTSFDLHTANGGCVELAIDMGHVFSDKGLQPIGEAELELKYGNVADLLDLAGALFEGQHCRLASRNKATLGYVLIGAESAKPPKPKPVSLPALTTGQSIEQTFIQQMDPIVAAILHNWHVMTQSPNPEGPHQLRINLRLLRSLLRAFRPVIDGPPLRALDKKARTLSRHVGQLRDMDVLVEDIYLPVVAQTDGDLSNEQRILTGRLKRYRDMVRRHVLEELEQWSHASFQIELALFTRQKAWRKYVSKPDRKAPIDGLAAKALDKSLGQAKRHGDHLTKLTPDERHAMRKRLKTLRYQGQLFATLYDTDKTNAFNKRLKALQKIFGYINDVEMAEKLGAVTQLAGGSDESDAAIVAHVLETHQTEADHAWHKAKKRWKQFDKAKMFWH